MNYSYQLACVGIEARQPFFVVERDFFLVKMGMGKLFTVDLDEYCNEPSYSQRDIHPDFLLNNTEYQEKV